MSKHHVKTHHWYDGVLQTLEHTFDNLVDAMEHVKTSGASHAKVYDENQNLVYAENPPATNSYA